ncbi:hypothetical protein CSW08_10170 [Confluentibacter flavum]|uniref:Uncharacterized protein n=2 Tax=Confluentibacter flavum TaxID=1909700 RepID=A0A2N3HJB2_9FLAO|nr:hypothetical protein CSW08_10170 [Confluentibacter flavum]
MCLSCKKTTQTSSENSDDATNKSQVITEKDISKLNYLDFAIDDRVEPIIGSWQEFNQLENIIENTKKGDLSYFKTDAKKNLQALFRDIRETIPDTINTPAILARITVLETKLYKTESLSNLSTTKKQELLNTLEELLVSFSNLSFQLNKKMENDSQNIEKPS